MNEAAKTPITISKVGIIGAGQMGSGIAHVCALSGFDVVIFDISDEQLKKAVNNIVKNIGRQVNKGFVSESDKQAALTRIKTGSAMTVLGDRDVVIEAATENEELKKKIFRDLCPYLKADALLCSNTSSISITRLAAITDRPERFMGMHFMNPVPVMKLVELIRGIATSEATFSAVRTFAEKLGKNTVTSEDFPAFIVNRILIPMLNEAIYTLYEGVANVRAIDVGIAEQHAVTFAAGLAADGMKPFCAIYSTFLQRGYDQVVHDVAIQNLPVRFALDRAGLVGEDGPTHAGSFDVGFLGALPGFVVMAAADEAELARMVATAVVLDDRPSAFRYPRGEGMGVAMPDIAEPLEIGRGRVLREGTSVAIVSFGTRLGESLRAADLLAARGLSATVADARFAKPLDIDLILRLAREHEALVTVEEGAIGGFGAFVLQALAEHGALDRGLKVRTLALPDVFQDHDKPERMYAQAGLDAEGIVHTVIAALGIEGTGVGAVRA